uniref:Major capsid protein n=1 Tax=Dulem virus 263 TaxID=3145740 RepID=A0AAU8B6S8_9VIRU
MAGFNYDQVRNHPSRDGADYSSKSIFSAKVGEILPTYWCFTQPDDVFQINYSWFTRTTPVNTAAYTRIREYFDFAFIPLRLLWRYAPEILTQMTDNIQSSSSSLGADTFDGSLPHTDFKDGLNRFCFALYDGKKDGKAAPYPSLESCYNNEFGFSRSDLAAKLAYMLGTGPFVEKGKNISGVIWPKYNPGTKLDQEGFPSCYCVNVFFSMFPWLAYQKFYSDYFRYTQWEKTQVGTFNVDYMIEGSWVTPSAGASNLAFFANPTLWDLRYCNWPKDMFTGILPSSQFGDVASISETTTSPAGDEWYVRFRNLSTSGTGNVMTAASSSSGSGVNIMPQGSGTGTYPLIPSHTQLVVKAADITTSFNALQLRLMQVTQKWKEITISGDQTSRDQIYKHFGVKLPAELSSMSKYIGGAASNLDISEVVNTNLAESSSVADIAGKGIGTGRGSHYIHVKEWGVLMCVYHAVPLLDYARQGIDPQFLYTLNTDFPIPEFDRIGYQSIPAVVFLNNYDIVPTTIGDKLYVDTNLGYSSRYYDWKTKVDTVNGMFLTTARQWVAPVGYDYLKAYFSKLNSSAWTSGQLITSNFFKVNPAILDSIFVNAADGTWDTDQLMVNAQFDVKKVQNLSSSSIPY